MIPADAFAGARLKVARARKHIFELSQAGEAYAAKMPVEFFENPLEDGRLEQKVRVHTLPSPELATVVAEALGGLRSSLDLAICAAASLRGAKNLEDISFHFAKSEEEWDNTIKGKTKGVPEATVKVMREFKPWRNGHKFLYPLSKLSAADKHRLLTPMVVNHGDTHISDGVFMEHIIVGGPWYAEKQEGTLYTTTHHPLNIKPKMGVGIYFAFGKVDILSERPILPALEAMATACDEVIWAVKASLVDPESIVRSSIL